MHSEPQPRIYLDNAASSPVHESVVTAMQPFWNQVFANANGIHEEGVAAKKELEEARDHIAKTLTCTKEEVTFVSGGTEANNMAVFGVVKAWCDAHEKNISDAHLITLSVEHSSVLDCFLELEKQGASVTYLPVSPEGILDTTTLRNALQENTILVSIMQVNSEIGAVYPLQECARILTEHKTKSNATYPVLHTDASQGPAYCESEVTRLGVDLMTIDGQKIYGPKGIGALYHRKDVPLKPLLVGGGQEKGLRPGTPATPLIVGLAAALDLVVQERGEVVSRLQELRLHFIDAVESSVPCAHLNGSKKVSAPHIVSFSFLGHDAEEMVLRLDAAGIAVATKSVCKGSQGASHVIAALGKGSEYATSMVRFSMSRTTTKEQLERVVAALASIAG